MSRPITRSLLRISNTLSHLHRAPLTRRFLSTAPPAQKSRSWKSSALRWGLAAGGIYYYNTSTLFADDATLLEAPLLPDSPTDDASLPTLESISKSRNTTTSSATSSSPIPPSTATSSPSTPPSTPNAPLSPSPLEATESEASSEGAFNEATGEINWDCPCLGGMADGPCGQQFRTAFSCFVFSKEEPKGMDCIEHFKGMQDCFREFPEIYGGELEEEEVEEEIQMRGRGQKEGEQEMPMHQRQTDGGGDGGSSAMAANTTIPQPATAATDNTPRAQTRDESIDQSEAAKTKRAKEATAQVQKDHSAPLSETDELVPKAAHDAR
ncbi:MAG: hypothetical protein Q9220_003846 [cf. Caloplaca sp. 1 TL-2023]